MAGTPHLPVDATRSPDAAREADAAVEKAVLAEKHIGRVRVAVILFNTAVYYGLMGRPATVPWLADAVTVLALAYAVAVVAFEPYRRFPALTSSYVTAASDGLLITLWLYATGGFHSPFYVLWYGSITAIAFRYGLRATLLSALAYGVLYAGLVAAMGQLGGNVPQLLIRVGYIALVGTLGGILGSELLSQTRAKLAARQRAYDALRETNRTLRSFIQGSPVAIVGLDPDGRVRLWNPAAERLFQRTEDETVGKPFPGVPAERAAEWEDVRRLAVEGYTITDRDLELARKDGSLREVSVSTAPLHGPDSGARGVVLIIADVTERRRAERDAEAARREAAHREKLSALGTLVAGVGHEISNPLSYMRATIDLTQESLKEALARPDLPAEAREAVASAAEGNMTLLEGVERVAHITASLKQVARAPHGERAPQDVHAILDSVLTVAAHRLKGGIRLRREFGAGAKAVVSSAEITQVFLNLVLNAADAMQPQGGGELVVRTFDSHDRVVVEVADTGPGIPHADRARIFTPFHTTKASGTGLGLSVSYGIVEAHRGRLSFESEPGRGTTFRVELPAARAALE